MPRGSGLSARNKEKQVQYKRRVREELERAAAGDILAKGKLKRTRREAERKAAVGRPAMIVVLLAATRQWRRSDVALFRTPSCYGPEWFPSWITQNAASLCFRPDGFCRGSCAQKRIEHAS